LAASQSPVELLPRPEIFAAKIVVVKIVAIKVSTVEVSGTRKSYSRNPGFTETRFRPLARRREITFWPPWVFMRVRNPCFLLRLRRLGWNVRLGMKDSYS
jgi:hypothetical protein